MTQGTDRHRNKERHAQKQKKTKKTRKRQKKTRTETKKDLIGGCQACRVQAPVAWSFCQERFLLSSPKNRADCPFISAVVAKGEFEEGV